MAMHVVFQWSVRPEEQEHCQELVGKIAEHIRTDHPEITATKLFVQWTGPLPRRAFIWMEEYADLEALSSGEITPSCMEVWKPVEQMAQPGTWFASVWFDGGAEAWMTREG